MQIWFLVHNWPGHICCTKHAFSVPGAWIGTNCSSFRNFCFRRTLHFHVCEYTHFILSYTHSLLYTLSVSLFCEYTCFLFLTLYLLPAMEVYVCVCLCAYSRVCEDWIVEIQEVLACQSVLRSPLPILGLCGLCVFVLCACVRECFSNLELVWQCFP